MFPVDIVLNKIEHGHAVEEAMFVVMFWSHSTHILLGTERGP